MYEIDKLVILGDFNARVGRDEKQWRGDVRKHGVGKMDSNGLLLLSKCGEHNLLITNTIFRLADKYKTSCMHPCSKLWHLIDYMITCQLDSSAILITRAMCGAECHPRHQGNVWSGVTSSSPGQCVEWSDVLVTRAMCGVEYWTDHRVIRASLNIPIVPQHHKRPKLIRQAFNTDRLLLAKYQQEYKSIFDHLDLPPSGDEVKIAKKINK